MAVHVVWNSTSRLTSLRVSTEWSMYLVHSESAIWIQTDDLPLDSGILSPVPFRGSATLSRLPQQNKASAVRKRISFISDLQLQRVCL